MKSYLKKIIPSILFALLIQTPGFSQQKGNEQMNQMLDYSRPGNNHALLNQLVGTWNFQDAKLSFVKGTLVRKPIYDGRFYSVEITGGKLPLPIANGKMKEDNYKSMQIEGYDNTRMKFYTTSINNHIGSDIQMQIGDYDATKKEFTYDWDSELIKGQPKKNRRVVKILDSSHYVELYYEEQANQYIKVRELDYSKSGE
ncbi:DUF1579 domain-containing protein [Pedobacter sp. HMF7647]|uniref:DUF1579 domain-containing protein n=1 Tax=Hufsiella arboris TaxID=2695275 RepID=A0A7K1Y4G2_9SPHI|nr:DUF1579 family protein [Hufsiella arboris]MXV49463.1 DUF1579 domain-containing protein [Hufsiella arboris]